MERGFGYSISQAIHTVRDSPYSHNRPVIGSLAPNVGMELLLLSQTCYPSVPMDSACRAKLSRVLNVSLSSVFTRATLRSSALLQRYLAPAVYTVLQSGHFQQMH